MRSDGWPFFDEHEASHLRRPHAFRTVDLSLVSRVLEPFWQRCADRVPSSVAPNAITLTGFSLVLATFAAAMVHDPSLRGRPSPWVCVAAIGTIFAFQTLDAIDGKQARKTKSSSALGNWVDHACDVASIQLAMATAAASIELGHGGATLFLLGSIVVNNFVTHWETRYTGTLHMGNGTSIYEAQLTMMVVHALTLVVGPELWARSIAELASPLAFLPFSSAPLRIWLVVVGVGAIGGVGIAGSLVRVARSVGFGEGRAKELACPLVLCAAGAVGVCAVDEPTTFPITFSVSLLGLRLIAAQILGQLGGARVRAFDPTTLPLVVSAPVLALLSGGGAALLAWGNFAFALLATLWTYVGATVAIARVLKLPILTLPRR